MSNCPFSPIKKSIQEKDKELLSRFRSNKRLLVNAPWVRSAFSLHSLDKEGHDYSTDFRSENYYSENYSENYSEKNLSEYTESRPAGHTTFTFLDPDFPIQPPVIIAQPNRWVYHIYR